MRKSRAANSRHKERNAEWNRNNRDHVNAKRREAYARKKIENPEALSQAKRSEKLRQRYGITPEQYDDMLKSQDFKCAICGSEAELCVDHCHTTGSVRGLLCHLCNVSLGGFKDNIASLAKAIEYLECKSQ